ncbi:MAG: RHS repeat-associated core domain-containing protein [Candidatus Omnitrophota bacterium]
MEFFRKKCILTILVASLLLCYPVLPQINNYVMACEQEGEGNDVRGSNDGFWKKHEKTIWKFLIKGVEKVVDTINDVLDSRVNSESTNVNFSSQEKQSSKEISTEQIVDKNTDYSASVSTLKVFTEDLASGSLMHLIGEKYLPKGMGVCKAGGKVFLILGTPVIMKGNEGLPATSLDFIPTYSSQSTYSQGPIGYGSQHNYNILLTEIIDQETQEVIGIRIKNEEGTLIDFAKNGTIYEAEKGFFSTLKQENGLFKWIRKYGTVYNFDAQNRLESIEDRAGNKLQLGYDIDGKLRAVTDDSGQSLTFSYNAQDLIETVTTPLNRVRTYLYDIEGRLVSVEAPYNIKTEFFYEDPIDIYKITKVKDARANETEITYDLSTNSVAAIKDPLQNEMTYSINKELSMIAVTDKRNNPTVFSYQDGAVISETCSLGTIGYGYDADINLDMLNDRNGNTTQWTYDDRGNVLQFYKDAFPKDIWNFTYSPQFNKLTSATDPLGYTTEYTVDPLNGNVTKIKDALAYETNFTYWPNGKVKTTTNAKSKTSNFEYDQYGNLSKFINALGKETNYGYDLVGNCTSVTDANSHTKSFGFDDLDRLVNITYPEPGFSDISFTYDENNNLKTITKILNAANKTTSLAYNENNQLVSLIDPMGHNTVYVYDPMGNLKKVTDANNNFVSWDYDVLQRPLKFYDRMNYVTEYTYDGQNRSSIKDAETNVTGYQYDGADRLDVTTFPDTSTEDCSYDKAGRLIQKKQRNGLSVSYEYTARNKLERDKSPGGSGRYYQYDSVKNFISVTDNYGTIAYGYDDVNRITSVTGPGYGDIQYTYDDAGNRKTMTDYDGNIINYEYNANDNLKRIKDSTNQILVEYTYDALGRRIRSDYLNGTYTEYTYNDADWLTSVVNRHSGGSVISSFSYTHDDVGNRLTMTTQQGAYTYTYDNNYQLKTAAYPDSTNITYNYDKVGNRTSVVKNGNTAIYVPNNLNQYEQVEGIDYNYDLNGNLTFDGEFTYIYQYYGSQYMLSQVKNSDVSASVSFIHNYRNQVTSTNSLGVGVRYYYDGDRCIMEKDSSSGTTISRYVYGEKLDEPVVMYKNGQTYFYHFDGLGNVVNLTDSSGNVVETYTYDAFGKPDQISGIGNPYYFAGRRYYDTIEIYYNRNRFYNPKLGRFISPDPDGYKDDINLYNYCKNNPVNFSDPYGLDARSGGCSKIDLKFGGSVDMDWKTFKVKKGIIEIKGKF